MVRNVVPGKAIVSAGALATIRAASVEAHPREAIGYLLGSVTHGVAVVVAATVDQFPAERTADCIFRSSKTRDDMEELFGDDIIGSWHSHPDDHPYISYGSENSDLEEMSDGDIELVMAIWPGKRKWRFKHLVYYKTGNKVRRIPC